MFGHAQRRRASGEDSCDAHKGHGWQAYMWGEIKVGSRFIGAAWYTPHLRQTVSLHVENVRHPLCFVPIDTESHSPKEYLLNNSLLSIRLRGTRWCIGCVGAYQGYIFAGSCNFRKLIRARRNYIFWRKFGVSPIPPSKTPPTLYGTPPEEYFIPLKSRVYSRYRVFASLSLDERK